MRPRKYRPRSEKISVFKNIKETPAKYSGSLCPVNVEEQKERFLRHGITPKFVLKRSNDAVQKALNKDRGQIRFDYFKEAKAILDLVKEKYGDGNSFIDEHYGPRVDYKDASEQIAVYLHDHGLEGEMTIYWTADLTCSARMMWHGPNLRYNKPEARKYTLIIKNSPENNLLRQHGVQCLANHEIGTHYFRMMNDGLQPWFSDRKKFGLKSMTCREACSTEEGLAAINTLIGAKTRYLWSAAILYYTACKATEMSFRELYEHLGTYVADPDQRWKHVMRVKRGLKDPNETGGYGNDQIYFEGAVDILRNIDNIDFMVLYSGKIALDEVSRVKRLARLDCIKIPYFIKDIEKYKRNLRQIAVQNLLVAKVEKKSTNHTKQNQRKRPVSQEKVGFHTPSPPLVKNKRQFSGSSRNSLSSSEGFSTPPLARKGSRHAHTSLPRISDRQKRQESRSKQSLDLSQTGSKSKESILSISEDEDDGEYVDEEDENQNKHPHRTERLVSRPKSLPNKFHKKKRKKKSKEKDLGWFGLLNRNEKLS